MNIDPESAGFRADLPPLTALLAAYAPVAVRPWHRLCWTLDQRLAAVVRRGGEPTIAAIRLAWWDAVLTEDDRSKGGGEPLVEAWRKAAAPEATPLAEQLIDGWRALLGAEAPSAENLEAFAAKRGGGLFRLIALGQSGDAHATAQAGAAWALWDLAGHARDTGLAAQAMAQARTHVARLPRRSAPKSLRLLHDLVARDVRSGRFATGGFAARHYRRLLWRGLLP